MRDIEAPAYIEYLEGFLGRESIDDRLSTLARELLHERGEVYRDYWLIPNRMFWIG